MLHTCTSFSREGSRACPSSLQKLLLVKREAALVLMACLVFFLKDASVFPVLGILPGHFFILPGILPGRFLFFLGSSWGTFTPKDASGESAAGACADKRDQHD